MALDPEAIYKELKALIVSASERRAPRFGMMYGMSTVRFLQKLGETQDFNDPPQHPNCRCTIDYVRDVVIQLVYCPVCSKKSDSETHHRSPICLEPPIQLKQSEVIR